MGDCYRPSFFNIYVVAATKKYENGLESDYNAVKNLL
jgi:hypothetical protein